MTKSAKNEKSWRSWWRTWQGAPKTVFFLHSYDEKNHSKKIPKKKKSAGVQSCWNKIALVNYLEETEDSLKNHTDSHLLWCLFLLL